MEIKIIEIESNLRRMHLRASRFKRKLHEKNDVIEEKRSVPLKFKDIFELYSSVSNLITSLSHIAHHFKISKVSPLVTFS